MLKAVIFDWDGTLADTQRSVVNSFRGALGEIGCHTSSDFIQRRIGIGAANTISQALRKTGLIFNREIVDGLVERKIELQLGLTNQVDLFQGARALLTALRHRTKMALASMNNKAVVHKLLEEKGVAEYFDVVLTVEDVTRPKPDPEIFLKCSAILKCGPERCAVVGDSIFDVEAAKSAGMSCVAIPSGAYSAEELGQRKPDLIVNSLKETGKILSFILESPSGWLNP